MPECWGRDGVRRRLGSMLLHRCEDLSSRSQHPYNKNAMAVSSCNPSAGGGAEAGGGSLLFSGKPVSMNY